MREENAGYIREHHFMTNFRSQEEWDGVQMLQNKEIQKCIH